MMEVSDEELMQVEAGERADSYARDKFLELKKLKIEGDNERKLFRLKIGREALQYVFAIIGLSLFLSFFVFVLFGYEKIFETPVMTVILSGLFSVLTLILGFVAGTSID